MAGSALLPPKKRKTWFLPWEKKKEHQLNVSASFRLGIVCQAEASARCTCGAVQAAAQRVTAITQK
jgi:hypothetical protein